MGHYEVELTDNKTLGVLAQILEITERQSFLEEAVQTGGTRSPLAQAEDDQEFSSFCNIIKNVEYWLERWLSS